MLKNSLIAYSVFLSTFFAGKGIEKLLRVRFEPFFRFLLTLFALLTKKVNLLFRNYYHNEVNPESWTQYRSRDS